MIIREKYDRLLSEYGFQTENEANNVNDMLQEVLVGFLRDCKKPAIWCYGEHTKMLMSDFMNELKQVKFIVDAHAEKYSDDSGFKVIHSQEVELYGIDGVVH